MVKLVKRFPIAIVLGCLMVWAAQVSAAEVTGLYKATVVVKDRTADARKPALAEGLQQVLVRVSGSSSVVDNEAVRQLLGNAGRFVVQYGYMTRDTLSPEDGRSIETILLNVTFDEMAVNQFLRKQGLPIWSSSRPQVVLWGAARVDGRRTLVGGSSQPALQALITQEAQRRGLPLILPEYDGKDQMAVREGDIWGMFVDPIVQASQRYQADVIVVAKLDTGSQNSIKTTIIVEGQQQYLDVSDSSLVRAVTLWMDKLGDMLGARYAVQASDEGVQQIVLDVDGLNSLKDYARLGEYLDSLLAVRSWHLQKVADGHQQYLLSLDGSTEALEQALRVDRKLVPQPPKLVVPLGGPVDPLQAPAGAAAQPEPGDSIEVSSVIPEAEASPVPQLPVIYYRWRR